MLMEAIRLSLAEASQQVLIFNIELGLRVYIEVWLRVHIELGLRVCIRLGRSWEAEPDFLRKRSGSH